MSIPKPKGDNIPPFSWGVRRGTINLYESFTLEGIEYSLYDTVRLRRNHQIDIGKLIRIFEMENHEKKVEVVWFFRPTDIANFLGDVKPLEREIFLACGEGKGLSNVNPLEAIIGKCNIVCSSKDQRNPQPTEKELGSADFFFYRAFDVGRSKVLEKFPSSIAGIKVNHFFNRRSSETSGDGSEPKAPLKVKSDKGLDVPGCTSSCGQINSSIRDRPPAGGKIRRSVHFVSAGPYDIGPTKKRKLLLSSGNRSDDALRNPPTTASGEDKYVKLSRRENTDLSSRKSSYSKTSEVTGKGPVNKQHVGTGISHKFSEVTNRTDDALPNPPTTASGEEKHVKLSGGENTDLSTKKSSYSQTSEFTGKGPANKQHVGTGISHKFSEVKRRPGMDASKWLKLEVWAEERLTEANEKGTLLVLENLDPSFAASEVEDIVWHVFRENVKAKMVQSTAFSSPHSGHALVMFKTSEAADKVMKELIDGCLVLGDGRPIFGRRKFLRRVGVADRFVGHLSIDRGRSYKQREEMRNAVSTSHFSQGNSIEFEMAIQWHALQEKTRRWWAALQEQQGKEIEPLMKRMKIHCPE